MFQKVGYGGGPIFKVVLRCSEKSCGIGKSKSQEKSKSRKKLDKIGKIGFDFFLDFLAKMKKCHKMS